MEKLTGLKIIARAESLQKPMKDYLVNYSGLSFVVLRNNGI
jgi:hypothetical protein